VVSGLAEYFSTVQGSVSHDEAQRMIMEGILEGKEVFTRHSSAVDNATAEFVGFDHSAASTFGSV
jgi:hypothetical protein